MSQKTRDQLIVQPGDGVDPEIGRWLWALEDARGQTNAILDTLTDPAILDWKPDWALHSVGTLLYHIALVEADWLYVEVLGNAYGQPYPGEMGTLFPYPMRTNNALTVVLGVSMDEHRARLVKTRRALLDAFGAMTLDDFRRTRAVTEADVTPEWVLYHLLEHEILHRTEIDMLRTQFKRETGV